MSQDSSAKLEQVRLWGIITGLEMSHIYEQSPSLLHISNLYKALFQNYYYHNSKVTTPENIISKYIEKEIEARLYKVDKPRYQLSQEVITDYDIQMYLTTLRNQKTESQLSEIFSRWLLHYKTSNRTTDKKELLHFIESLNLNTAKSEIIALFNNEIDNIINEIERLKNEKNKIQPLKPQKEIFYDFEQVRFWGIITGIEIAYNIGDKLNILIIAEQYKELYNIVFIDSMIIIYEYYFFMCIYEFFTCNFSPNYNNVSILHDERTSFIQYLRDLLEKSDFILIKLYEKSLHYIIKDYYRDPGNSDKVKEKIHYELFNLTRNEILQNCIDKIKDILNTLDH